MNTSSQKILNDLICRYPDLNSCKDSITNAFNYIKHTYSSSGKVLICGNGGSAADSDHIVGELMKGFLYRHEICVEDRERLISIYQCEGKYLADNLQNALPAISLTGHPALAYAYINDVAADMVFAQQVYIYGKQGDILLVLSTSGNSANIVNAVKVARASHIITIGLTGGDGGLLKSLCDIVIIVPARETYRIQEYHQPIYHALCAMIENEFFGEKELELPIL